MKITNMTLGEDGRDEENTIEILGSKGETLLSRRCRRKLQPQRTLILNVRRSRVSVSCRELFLHNVHGLYNSVPKHITTFDEKYVLRCLELIRNYALRAATQSFTSKVNVLPDQVSSLAEIKNRSSYHRARLAIECPFSSTDDLTIGTVSGSQSMINILKSSLLQRFGSFDSDVNFRRTDLFDVSVPFFTDVADSLQVSSGTLSCKQQKEVKVLDDKYLLAPMHKRDASMSSTNSSCSDQSSSSTYGSLFQGMLQCSWKDGLPHHVFTVDDKNEVYVARSSKVKASDDKGLDYVYTFHSRGTGKKECDIHDLELESVAKMRVSTSITFSSNNSEVKETQFILSVSSDNHTREMQMLNHTLQKNKGLTRKVADVFRPSHTYKPKPSSKLAGSTAISEDVYDNCLDLGEGCKETKYAPNLELAAIVVKHICSINSKEDKIGGWGLKFLKRPGNNASLDTSIPSKCSRNTGECSSSVNIIIPAGFHGGPRTRVGGPSSLTERWISGGRCDCGGWDIGCPLTILNMRSTSMDYSSPVDDSKECKSVDLFTQGSKQNVPLMKMLHIHDGLYYVHFQSSLSTLQSFAIAAAIIHSHSPVLRSKACRSCINRSSK
ncbi:hypothetical protein CDL12_25960 [Handroanthus impetiginosus]|uniref:Uncharacterized protein n=1 Tax=Handroanthus impetiginosus TaxID=429701 RepID=A0A2G9G8B4_9LAMI|nr:hypothetical protein CDL12_25960 [Handroanthus impetiginosus]